MNTVDLHVHTSVSDGTMSPEEVLEYAKEMGIKYLGITDHDTMEGYLQAKKKESDIVLVPGIEISTDYKGEDVHVLGYLLDPKSPKLQPVLEFVQKDRVQRNVRIIKLMKKDGINISYKEMEEEYGDIIGRPHFAKVLVRQGRVDSIKDAFEKYLGDGKKYYLPRSYIPIVEAIQIIHDCGGVAILAHPYQYGFEMDSFLEDVYSYGIDGLEVYYSGYDEKQIQVLLDFAKRKNLKVTGGSDFHGKNKPNISLGSVCVPESCVKNLVK